MFGQQPQPIEQQQEYEEDNRQQIPQIPETQYQPMMARDDDFLKWLLNFKNQVVFPLKMTWRGFEQNQLGEWAKAREPKMNEKGISWAISYIESYINPIYIVSNYNLQYFNYSMRSNCKVIYNKLFARAKEFDIDKFDIEGVGLEIELKIQALLLGAMNNGFRDFFTKTSQRHEIIQNNAEPQQQKRGLFTKAGRFFKTR